MASDAAMLRVRVRGGALLLALAAALAPLSTQAGGPERARATLPPPGQLRSDGGDADRDEMTPPHIAFFGGGGAGVVGAGTPSAVFLPATAAGGAAALAGAAAPGPVPAAGAPRQAGAATGAAVGGRASRPAAGRRPASAPRVPPSASGLPLIPPAGLPNALTAPALPGAGSRLTTVISLTAVGLLGLVLAALAAWRVAAGRR